MRAIRYLILAAVFVASLMMITGVHASTPNNEVTQLLDAQVVNGVNEVGEILTIARPYISDLHNMTNFTQITVQRYDRFTWLGTESVVVRDPLARETVLVPGAQYYFSQIGLHSLTSLTNITRTTNIIAVGEPQNFVTITIDDIPTGFAFEFSENSFILTDERVTEATLTVDDDISPGDYSVNYTVDGVSLVYEFELIRNVAWNITKVEFDVEQTIKSGEDEYLGVIEVENIGNQDVEITLGKTGNQSRIVVVPQPKTLFKKTKLEFDIQLNVPSVTPVGTYDIDIIVSDVFGHSQNVSLEIEVVDAILPVIEEINFSSDKAFIENEITVIATDNSEVVNVTLEYDDEMIFLKKDVNQFTATLVFNKISKYDMVFCALDVVGNKACQHVNRTFHKIQAINNTQKKIKMPTVRYSKYSNAFLFDMTESIEEGIGIELVSMESDVANDESYTVRLVDDDGGIKRFDSYDNEIIIKDKGKYYLEVRSEEQRDYQGLLRFNAPDYVDEVQDVAFDVSFKDYDIPTNFSIDWFGKTVSCDVVDTGDLDTSHRICPIQIPIDVDENDIALPTTIREREQLDSQVKDVKDELSTSKRRAAVIITMLVVITIFMVVLIYYMVNIYPYSRSLRKVKSE